MGTDLAIQVKRSRHDGGRRSDYRMSIGKTTVVVCPARAVDPVEAVVHGVLHVCGYDHGADHGEMLALQDRVMAELGQ